MPGLELELLGGFSATLDGQALTTFESQKVRALLAFLATEAEQAHSRDSLAGLLWPEEPDQTARKNLRVALSNLRTVIRDAQVEPPFLHISRPRIQFNAESKSRLDCAARLDACAVHRHRRADTCTRCANRRRQAVALYRGEFLAGEAIDSHPFEDWLYLLRERFQQLAQDALAQLCAYHETRQEFELLQDYARHWLELAPWEEAAHRALMRALAAGDQRNATLR